MMAELEGANLKFLRLKKITEKKESLIQNYSIRLLSMVL